MRLAQLESQLAEIKNSTIVDVQQKLRRLKDIVEETSMRLDEFVRKSVTLDDLLGTRVRVDRHETELVDLQRQGEPVGNKTFPIPLYSGERSILSRLLQLFYTWMLSHQTEDASNYSRPILMKAKKSRRELEGEYGRPSVEQSLTVSSAITKAVEKDNIITGIVVGAKAPSEAWKILSSMIDSKDSERAREHAKKYFEESSTATGLSMKEYIDSAKSLAINIQHHSMGISDHEISRRVLNGLPSTYAPEKCNFKQILA